MTANVSVLKVPIYEVKTSETVRRRRRQLHGHGVLSSCGEDARLPMDAPRVENVSLRSPRGSSWKRNLTFVSSLSGNSVGKLCGLSSVLKPFGWSGLW